jgi:hypothetical protein
LICPDSAVELVAGARIPAKTASLHEFRGAAMSAAAHSIVGGKLRARPVPGDRVKLRIFLVCMRQWAKINHAVHGKIVTHCN